MKVKESPISQTTTSTGRYELLLVMVTLIAAAGWVFTKSALAEFSPYLFLSLRFLLAATILALLCWQDLMRLDLKQVIRGGSTGTLLGGALLVWVLGVDQTESIGEGAFIVSLTVVFIPLISRVFFGNKMSINVILALIPAVLGLALLALNIGPKGELILELEATHYLFLLSTIGFALHVILTGKYAQNISYMALSTVQLMAIGLVAMFAALLTESVPEQLSSLAWFWLLCSAVIATSLRFALQTKALAKLDPNSAAMVFILEPVWTALLGAWFLNERMTQYQLAGCFLIFLALVIYRLPGGLVRIWRSRYR